MDENEVILDPELGEIEEIREDMPEAEKKRIEENQKRLLEGLPNYDPEAKETEQNS